MLSFQEMFFSQHSNHIIYNGRVISRHLPIAVSGKVNLRFRILGVSSPYTQAIVIVFPSGFSGNVYLLGKRIPIRKSAFPKLNFWSDTAPSDFEVEISDFVGEILICNGSDPLATKQFCKHLSAGCAMIVDEFAQNKFRCVCNDHEEDDDFNDLIFEVEVV